MSYSQGNVYREREVLTASPEKLVVMTFDHVLVNLRRARMAIVAGNIELRAQSMSKARDGVMELLMSTDTDRGGEIAINFARATSINSIASRRFSPISGMRSRRSPIAPSRLHRPSPAHRPRDERRDSDHHRPAC
jgi:flagellar biosynthetic protein FliS